MFQNTSTHPKRFLFSADVQLFRQQNEAQKRIINSARARLSELWQYAERRL
jgi:hypothetical protein